MLPEIFNIDNLENILKYCNILTSSSINIPNRKYFLSQKKYEKVPIIGETTANLLYILAKIKRPKNILEIGFGSGFSSISILSGLTIDNFNFISLEREKKRYNRGRKLIEHFNYPINLLNIDFFDFIGEIEKAKLKFDFIFVDSVKKRYLEIFKILKPYINKNGLIIFDNVLFSGRVVSLKSTQVKKYLNGAKSVNVFNNYISLDIDFNFIFLPIDDGIAIGIKK